MSVFAYYMYNMKTSAMSHINHTVCVQENHLPPSDVDVISVRLGGAPELSVGVAVGGALAVLHLVKHEREGAGNSLL